MNVKLLRKQAVLMNEFVGLNGRITVKKYSKKIEFGASIAEWLRNVLCSKVVSGSILAMSSATALG